MVRKKKPVLRLAPDTVSPPPFDPAGIAHELRARALQGDEEAIREILFAAHVFAGSLVDLAYEKDESTQARLKRVAAGELKWPAVVSRHKRITGNSKEISNYLDHIGLGAEVNINSDAPDTRTDELLEGTMFFFDAIRRRGNVTPVRGGLNRDAWLACENGKCVTAEIEAILDFYKNGLHRSEPIKVLIARAESQAKSEAKTKDLPRVKEIAIRRHLVLIIARQIHGMLRD